MFTNLDCSTHSKQPDDLDRINSSISMNKGWEVRSMSWWRSASLSAILSPNKIFCWNDKLFSHCTIFQFLEHCVLVSCEPDKYWWFGVFIFLKFLWTSKWVWFGSCMVKSFFVFFAECRKNGIKLDTQFNESSFQVQNCTCRYYKVQARL